MGNEDSKLKTFAATRPFVQQGREPFCLRNCLASPLTFHQIDVIFPYNAQFEETLLSLKSNRYARGRVSIAKLVEKAAQAGGFINSREYSR